MTGMGILYGAGVGKGLEGVGERCLERRVFAWRFEWGSKIMNI